MIDKTARETQALKDARPHFAEALTALGLMAPFFDRSAAPISWQRSEQKRWVGFSARRGGWR